MLIIDILVVFLGIALVFTGVLSIILFLVGELKGFFFYLWPALLCFTILYFILPYTVHNQSEISTGEYSSLAEICDKSGNAKKMFAESIRDGKISNIEYLRITRARESEEQKSRELLEQKHNREFKIQLIKKILTN